jgi:hypothetical protein
MAAAVEAAAPGSGSAVALAGAPGWVAAVRNTVAAARDVYLQLEGLCISRGSSIKQLQFKGPAPYDGAGDANLGGPLRDQQREGVQGSAAGTPR